MNKKVWPLGISGSVQDTVGKRMSEGSRPGPSFVGTFPAFAWYGFGETLEKNHQDK